jgi:hypothetical protein
MLPAVLTSRMASSAGFSRPYSAVHQPTSQALQRLRMHTPGHPPLQLLPGSCCAAT